jgi:hypothetical protein
MEKQTKFTAAGNWKSGVGKSAITVLITGYFHNGNRRNYQPLKRMHNG